MLASNNSRASRCWGVGRAVASPADNWVDLMMNQSIFDATKGPGGAFLVNLSPLAMGIQTQPPQRPSAHGHAD